MTTRRYLPHLLGPLTIFAVSVLFAPDARAAQIVVDVIDADFDAAPIGAGTGGTTATATLLNQGTVLGTWTADNIGTSEIVRDTSSPGNQAFKLDQNVPDYTIDAQAPALLGGGATVSFDVALRRINANKNALISLFDSGSNPLLTLVIDADFTATSQQLGYLSGGSPVFLGPSTTIPRFSANGDTDLSAMREVSVTVGSSGFSISLDGSQLVSGIPLDTPGATDLASIQFFGDTGGAGYFIDNVSASFSIPEPGTISLWGLGLVGLIRLGRKRQAVA